MRALQITTYGQAPALQSLPTPAPAPDEVQVRIEACGLNFADMLMIDGKYQERPDPPVTLGMELAGTITGTGSDVTEFSIGDRVAVFSGQGGLAEAGCFPAARCTLLPPDMPATDAAAFQVAFGTSHVALTHKARLRSGERLVVTGAAGGVGLTAVQIGKLLGAEVIAIARGGAKLAIAKAAGADHVIDSESDDIRGQIKALGGADVVYDAVGGALFDACLRATNPDGRVIVIGFASGELPKIKANYLLVKNLSVIGFYWGGYLNFAPQVLTSSLAQLFEWYQEGTLKPHISHILPLDQAEEALDLIRQRKSTGKVVVTMV